MKNVKLKVSFTIECKTLTLIRVKAYKRTTNGKTIKVRSYYRRK